MSIEKTASLDRLPSDPGDGVGGARAVERLSGRLNTLDLVFIVLAFNAPLSVVVGYVPVIIGAGNGLGAPVTFLCTGALIALFAVGFTTMSRHLPNPGAYYAYITAGLGKPLGLGSSSLAIFAYYFILLGSYCFGSIFFQQLVRDVFNGPDVPGWVWLAILQVAAGVLGYFRITVSAKILTVAMCLEVICIAAWDAVVLVSGGPEGRSLDSFSASSIFSGAVGLAVLFGVTCFSGFEATAVFREESRSPEKTIPRATYIAIGAMGVMYSLAALVLIIGTGPSSVVAASAADPTGTVEASFQSYLGVLATDVITVLLCTSIFAAILSTHNIGTRYIYSLSVDQVLHKSLSAVHSRHGSPHRASVLISIAALIGTATLVALSADLGTVYAALVGIGGYSLLVLMMLTSIAVIPYFARRRANGLEVSVWKSVVAPAAAAVGLFAALVLATQNLTLLIGQSQDIANLLLVITFGLIVAGAVYAIALRRLKPSVYATIGRQNV